MALEDLGRRLERPQRFVRPVRFQVSAADAVQGHRLASQVALLPAELQGLPECLQCGVRTFDPQQQIPQLVEDHRPQGGRRLPVQKCQGVAIVVQGQAALAERGIDKAEIHAGRGERLPRPLLLPDLDHSGIEIDGGMVPPLAHTDVGEIVQARRPQVHVARCPPEDGRLLETAARLLDLSQFQPNVSQMFKTDGSLPLLPSALEEVESSGKDCGALPATGGIVAEEPPQPIESPGFADLLAQRTPEPGSVPIVRSSGVRVFALVEAGP
jgi:hypothetical protein